MKTVCLEGETASFEAGLVLLLGDLDLALSEDGFPIHVRRGEQLSVDIRDGEAVLTWGKKVEFFRGLCLMTPHLDEDTWSLKERASFQENGIMFDCSRNAVLTIDTLQFFLKKMALMGLNLGMLYTEDTYCIKGHPYFGYARGSYSYEELKHLDDYAYALGIELIPCVQTLAHLDTFLRWPAAKPIKDTTFTLLVDNEATYAFIEEMLRAATAPYRSRRIHIGMDEAGDMGNGAYRALNGYVERKTLMARHLERVNQIVAKLNLEAMMWSDMHIINTSGQPLLEGYYPMDISRIPEDIRQSAPKHISLVYWDYYHTEEEVYDHQLGLHEQFEAETIFAGGIWTWTGPSADYQKTIETTVPALSQCRKHGIQKVFATAWGDDGGETNLLTLLYGLQLFAELDYTGEYNPAQINARFKQSVGCDAQPFLDLARFNNIPGLHFSFHPADLSKMLLFEDPLLGMFEADFEGVDLQTHYQDLAQAYDAYARTDSSLGLVWAFYAQFADALVKKSQWRAAAAVCVREKDKERAKQLVECARENIVALEKLGQMWQQLWFSTNKPFGYEVIDIRMGGLVARFKSAEKRMVQFANGEIDDIPELSCTKLPYAKAPSGTFFPLRRWKDMVSPGRV